MAVGIVPQAHPLIAIPIGPNFRITSRAQHGTFLIVDGVHRYRVWQELRQTPEAKYIFTLGFLLTLIRHIKTWTTLILHSYRDEKIWWDPDKNDLHGITQIQLHEVAHRRNAGNTIAVQDTDLAVILAMRNMLRTCKVPATLDDVKATFAKIRPCDATNPDYVRWFSNFAIVHWREEAFWSTVERHVQACSAVQCKIALRQAVPEGKLPSWRLPCLFAFLDCICQAPKAITANKYKATVWPAIQAFQETIDFV